MPVDPRAALRLYLIADPDQCATPLLPAVAAAISGGVTAVQLRAKSLTDRDRVTLGRELHQITAASGIPLLVNDRLDIALAIGAEGVHLGVTDLPPEDARRLAPPGFLIGYSPDDAGDRVGNTSADYLGIGPVYGTASKADAGAALGVHGFAGRVGASDLPVIGIGGIDETNAAAVIDAGAIGVAVISAILRAPDPRESACRLREAVDLARRG